MSSPSGWGMHWGGAPLKGRNPGMSRRIRELGAKKTRKRVFIKHTSVWAERAFFVLVEPFEIPTSKHQPPAKSPNPKPPLPNLLIEASRFHLSATKRRNLKARVTALRSLRPPRFDSGPASIGNPWDSPCFPKRKAGQSRVSVFIGAGRWLCPNSESAVGSGASIPQSSFVIRISSFRGPCRG